MTKKKLYETIKQKIESAENHYKRMMLKEEQGEEVFATRLVLKGNIEAYTDVSCLLESSCELNESEQVLYDELIMYFNIYVVARTNRINLINILDDLIEEVKKNDQERKTEN